MDRRRDQAELAVDKQLADLDLVALLGFDHEVSVGLFGRHTNEEDEPPRTKARAGRIVAW